MAEAANHSHHRLRSSQVGWGFYHQHNGYRYTVWMRGAGAWRCANVRERKKERKRKSVDFRELQVPTQPCPEDTAMCRFRAPLKEERTTVGRVCLRDEQS